jgi:hypothetical protein
MYICTYVYCRFTRSIWVNYSQFVQHFFIFIQISIYSGSPIWRRPENDVAQIYSIGPGNRRLEVHKYLHEDCCDSRQVAMQQKFFQPSKTISKFFVLLKKRRQNFICVVALPFLNVDKKTKCLMVVASSLGNGKSWVCIRPTRVTGEW